MYIVCIYLVMGIERDDRLGMMDVHICTPVPLQVETKGRDLWGHSHVYSKRGSLQTYKFKEPLGSPILEGESSFIDYPVTTEHTQLPRPLLLSLYYQLLHNTCIENYMYDWTV